MGNLLRAVTFALMFLLLVPFGSNHVVPVHADPTAVARIRCSLVAPLIDGNPADPTTAADIQTACQERLPNSAVAALDALADGDGQLELSDVGALEGNSDNVLDASCIQATMNCAMLIFAFLQDDEVVTLDTPAGLATIESGVADAVCSTEGSGLGQDEDCNNLIWGDGDWVVVFHVMNSTGTNGQSFVVGVVQEAVEIQFPLTLGVPAGAQDHDADGVPTYIDNCPLDPNPGQLNTDSAPLILAGAPSDVTVPTSDRYGDACDSDDDNDWLGDIYEPAFPMPDSPPGPCVPAPGPTLVLNADTDGDRVRDGAECLMGYDPTSAASRPPVFPAGDSDSDGLPDYIEDIVGSDSFDKDSDNDGITDGIEVKGYQSSPTTYNTDLDACGDRTEIASVNADRIVNAQDLLAVAIRFGSTTAAMMDVNKDRAVNSLDLVVVATAFTVAPC